jgi:hypothetical protein
MTGRCILTRCRDHYVLDAVQTSHKAVIVYYKERRRTRGVQSASLLLISMTWLSTQSEVNLLYQDLKSLGQGAMGLHTSYTSSTWGKGR